MELLGSQFSPDIVYVDNAVRGLPTTQQILARLRGVAVETIERVSDLVYPDDPSVAKRRWLLTSAPKPWFRVYDETDSVPLNDPDDPLGLPYHHAVTSLPPLTLGCDFITNVPYDCSFCASSRVLVKRPLLTLHVNVVEVLSEFERRAAKMQDRVVILRCGHLGDALAVDEWQRVADELVTSTAWMPNVRLELWTRTANVSHLRELDHRGHTTVIFAVSPAELINTEERGTAALLDRLAAARELASVGYRIVYAIDPIVQMPGWEELYDTLIDELLANTPHSAVDRIELSCFHYPRGLSAGALERFPRSRIYYGELVPVNGCFRYFRPVRQRMYDYLRDSISRRAETLPVRIVKEHGLLGELARLGEF